MFDTTIKEQLSLQTIKRRCWNLQEKSEAEYQGKQFQLAESAEKLQEKKETAPG